MFRTDVESRLQPEPILRNQPMMSFQSFPVALSTAKRTPVFVRTPVQFRSVVRTVVGVAALTLIVATMPGVAFSQEEDAAALVPRAPSPAIVTKDGLPLSAMYWPSRLKAQGGVVVLLHGLSGNQLDWGKLPDTLQGAGYAVIAVDLRGHGQSTGKLGAANDAVEAKAKSKSKAKPSKAAVESTTLKARDFQAMVQLDMKAVKQFIFSEHQKQMLNMNKTAIIGAGLGATVALKFAEFDWLQEPYNDGPIGNQTPRGQDVRALVLLTPDADVSGLPLPDAVKVLRAPLFNVAIMFGVGNKDKQDKGQTKKLYDLAITPDKNIDRMYLQEYNSTARGCGLLGRNLPVEQNILKFLEAHLSSVQSEWRDRESRVGKKPAK